MTYIYLPKTSNLKTYPKLNSLRFQPLNTMSNIIEDDLNSNPFNLEKRKKYCIVVLGSLIVYSLILIFTFCVLMVLLNGWGQNGPNWNWWMYLLYLYISLLISFVFVSWVPLCLYSILSNNRVFIYPGRIPHDEDEFACITETFSGKRSYDSQYKV